HRAGLRRLSAREGAPRRYTGRPGLLRLAPRANCAPDEPRRVGRSRARPCRSPRSRRHWRSLPILCRASAREPDRSSPLPSLWHLRTSSMFDETISKLSALGAAKARLLEHNPLGFFIGSAMAGIYVGFAILLIFS